MHPYEMQRLIRERGKDQLLVLKPGSLYHAIGRLEKAGLIEPVETTREGKRPERTTYRITEDGVETVLEWMRDMLSRPSSDPNEFLAAIAHLPHLQPDEVIACLEARTGFLEAQIAKCDSQLRVWTPRIGRLVLLETELERARAQADLAWVQGLIEDLRNGVLEWDTRRLLANPGLPTGGGEVSP
jgi:DNA-binding PadR family transcriptional regulator